MNHHRRWLPLIAIFLLTVGPACGEGEADDNQEQTNQPEQNDDDGPEFAEPFSDDCAVGVEPADDPEQNHTNILGAIIGAEEGDVVCLNAGEYELHEQLSVRTDDLEIRGESRDDVILDFSNQDTGVNGIDVASVENFQIRSLSVIDAGGEASSSGDGIRLQNVTNGVIDDVRVDWTGEPDTDNGDYGLYPVNSEKIIVENSIVSGAADAGIYLGQTEYGIIRNNEVFENVAGIEVENSTHVDVYGNVAYDNTGGILVFNLPELQRKEGMLTRVFDNEVYDNNHRNFAASGAIVQMVPSGSGVLIVAVQDVEIFDNDIEDHDSIGVGIVSYQSLGLDYDDDEYYPFAERIDVHSNTIINAGNDPEPLASTLTGLDPITAIAWDGVYNDELDEEERYNCFTGNTDGDGDPVDYANFGVDDEEDRDAGPEFADDCERDSLPEVDF